VAVGSSFAIRTLEAFQPAASLSMAREADGVVAEWRFVGADSAPLNLGQLEGRLTIPPDSAEEGVSVVQISPT